MLEIFRLPLPRPQVICGVDNEVLDPNVLLVSLQVLHNAKLYLVKVLLSACVQDLTVPLYEGLLPLYDDFFVELLVDDV